MAQLVVHQLVGQLSTNPRVSDSTPDVQKSSVVDGYWDVLW